MSPTITTVGSLKLALGLLCLAAPAGAQARFGPEVGLLGAFDESLFQVGFRFSDPTPGRLGAEFVLATYPDGWPEGAVLTLGDLGVAVAIPASPVWRLVPHAGVSALLALGGGGGGGGAAGGWHVGLGLSVETVAGPSLRLDWTSRSMLAGEGARFTTITVGLAWRMGPERPPPPAGMRSAGHR